MNAIKGFLLVITMFGHDVSIAAGPDRAGCVELRDDLTKRYRAANPGSAVPKMECVRGK